MPFITNKGLFGSSLQRTCLVIGIVFVVLHILSVILGFFYTSSFYIYGLPSILRLVIAICLILAAILKNKYLCIPWFIGFAIAIILCIMALVDIINYSRYSSYYVYDEYNQQRSMRIEAMEVIGTLIYCTIFFLIELLLLRYVLSYYKQLD